MQVPYDAPMHNDRHPNCFLFNYFQEPTQDSLVYPVLLFNVIRVSYAVRSACSDFMDMLRGALQIVVLLLGFTITMVKTIVFVSIIILFSFFLSFQTKFIGHTCNIYRYGPLVDLSTLTHFQRP